MSLQDAWEKVWAWLTGRHRALVVYEPRRRHDWALDDILWVAEQARAAVTRQEEARFEQGLAALGAIEREAFEAFLLSPADEYEIWSAAEAKMARLVADYRSQPHAQLSPTTRLRLR